MHGLKSKRMTEKNITVREDLQEAYDEQYTKESTEWRDTGANAKAKNIIYLAGNNIYKKVLEVGAGDGAILKKINDSNFCEELYALEISDSGIEKIKERNLSKVKSVQKFDGYSTNFADKEFDLIYCSHVIEHVEHPRILFREIKRISRKQIFEIPIDFSFSVDKKAKHFLSYGHINIYTPALFRFLLFSEGFKIISGFAKMLDNDVERLIYKKKKKELSFLKYSIFKTKSTLVKIVWKMLPKRFKELKPQTYTVMTES